MEHWSKTSLMEPFPLGGKRKKRDVKDVDGDQGPFSPTKAKKVEKSFPIVRVPHGIFMRPVETNQGMINKELPEIQVNHIKSPKFLRNLIFDLQDGILVPKLGHEQKASSSKNIPPSSEHHENSDIRTRIEPRPSTIDNENEIQELKKDVIQENSKPQGLRSSTSSSGQSLAREKVKDILHHFRHYVEHVFKEERRPEFAASNMIKNKFWYPHVPILGSVPGIEIGDRFHNRMEIHVLCLHRPPQGGIDWMDYGRRKVAISVVASGGYSNHLSNQGTLIYSGQGGNQYGPGTQGTAEDQKLSKGNLALMNSIVKKNPVRVIRRSAISGHYFYDGLYTVEKIWKERGNHGKLIFKFKLEKIPGQVSLSNRRN
ncbi:histone-lysine N-methyltransferase, H3 lysine-9 specific SUVH6 [Coffea arabica]|uniref:Histone-lysine N-methyltransferase, H3 lysine-9 specific SUVH6-like n=1 Tax=Coffea arabica TaxID=13443 RepID=A0A6P6TMV4_COFAR|nr:histone-lysine N-methyltransferase, H3 lysine-9 specific SUVH6-like [Coffea arabica]XP_027079834.1 histone-lysine N-methyltransferase, H3 lysine-9 specific SUVH6-like [Coffea arabica]